MKYQYGSFQVSISEIGQKHLANPSSGQRTGINDLQPQKVPGAFGAEGLLFFYFKVIGISSPFLSK